MRIAIYPGTFDPVTNGHLDILNRAVELFDKVIVGVATENYKKNLFSAEERVSFLRQVLKDMPTVEVDIIPGLLMHFAEKVGACAVIRGLRAVSDFEYEFQLSLMNKKLNDKVETIFFMTSSEYTFISSSIIKQVSSLNGCIHGLVPEIVEEALIEKYRKLEEAKKI